MIPAIEEPEVPLGECPDIPSPPQIFRWLDQVLAENVILKRKLADKTAEYDNLFPALRDAGKLIATLTTELGQYKAALEESRDAYNEAADEVDALQERAVRVEELERTVAKLTTQLDQARNERDTAKGAATGGGVL